MSNDKENTKKPNYKRTILEWAGIAAVCAFLYFTGLHTQVLGSMQRAILWTGFFDADAHKVETTDGPMLSERTFRIPLTTPDNHQVKLGDFKGKVLFVNIWASWCPPCVAEMPTIESLYNNLADNEDIKFLLISLDEKPKKATEFMENKDYPMPYYFPSSGLPKIFRSPYIPSTYVVSKEGKIIYKREGIADYSSASFSNWLANQAD